MSHLHLANNLTASWWPYLQAKRNEVHPSLSLSIESMKCIHNYLCALNQWSSSIIIFVHWVNVAKWDFFETFKHCDRYVVANYWGEAPDETKISGKCQWNVIFSWKKNEIAEFVFGTALSIINFEDLTRNFVCRLMSIPIAASSEE